MLFTWFQSQRKQILNTWGNIFLTSAEVWKPVPKTGSNSSLTHTSQLHLKTFALQMFALHWADWSIWKLLKFTYSFLPQVYNNTISLLKNLDCGLQNKKNKHTHRVNFSHGKFWINADLDFKEIKLAQHLITLIWVLLHLISKKDTRWCSNSIKHTFVRCNDVVINVSVELLYYM